jgi:glucosamine--fructose-6-phosphate aminotransferase (isomerizing)
MIYAKSKGAPTCAIVNAAQSSLDRGVDVTLLTHAGPEIGVASTKAFTCQLGVLACLALAIAHKRGHMTLDIVAQHTKTLAQIPHHMIEVLAKKSEMEALAHRLQNAPSVLFMGRHLLYPMALEGALKLKELSYIHAEGYPGGELKHGPIALIDDKMPVIVLFHRELYVEKMMSNAQEVLARGAQIIAIADLAPEPNEPWVDSTFILPQVPGWAAPFMYALPMQLLAYYTACLKGTDVDQPRNLAKSVTVE